MKEKRKGGREVKMKRKEGKKKTKVFLKNHQWAFSDKKLADAVKFTYI